MNNYLHRTNWWSAFFLGTLTGFAVAAIVVSAYRSPARYESAEQCVLAVGTNRDRADACYELFPAASTMRPPVAAR